MINVKKMTTNTIRPIMLKLAEYFQHNESLSKRDFYRLVGHVLKDLEEEKNGKEERERS